MVQLDLFEVVCDTSKSYILTSEERVRRLYLALYERGLDRGYWDMVRIELERGLL